jgi:chromosome segregation ATPase
LDYNNVLKNNKILRGKLEHDRKRLKKACQKNKNLSHKLEETSEKLEREQENLAFAKRQSAKFQGDATTFEARLEQVYVDLKKKNEQCSQLERKVDQLESNGCVSKDRFDEEKKARDGMENMLCWLLDQDTEQAASVARLEEENRELRADLEIMKFDASYDEEGVKARFEQVKTQKKKYMEKALELEVDLQAAQAKIAELEGELQISGAVKMEKL